MPSVSYHLPSAPVTWPVWSGRNGLVPTNLNLLPSETSLNESIMENTSFMEVTAELSQVDRSREESALSSAKARVMFVTFETSHPETFSFVSDVQFWKAWFMPVRLRVFQVDRSREVREVQLVNMQLIVLHFDMSSFETSAVFMLRSSANQNPVSIGEMPSS